VESGEWKGCKISIFLILNVDILGKILYIFRIFHDSFKIINIYGIFLWNV
jgi:hypothetical protein